MAYDPERHHRRSIRLPSHDYTRAGAYFITICTDARRCAFGDIQGGRMAPNSLGQIVQSCWDDLPNHAPRVELDAFQIMPNHIHCVLWLLPVVATPASPTPAARNSAASHPVGATPASPSAASVFQTPSLVRSLTPNSATRPRGPDAGSIGAIIGGFKSAVSRRAKLLRADIPKPIWQRDYFEHVIRSDEALAAIREYVWTNPERWHADKENPQGRGTDDVEVWVKLLSERVEQKKAGISDGAAGGGRAGGGDAREGDAGVAPTGGERAPRESSRPGGDEAVHRHDTRQRATQASPLQDLIPRDDTDVRAARASSEREGVRPRDRIGHGYDLHGLEAGPRLVLGGVIVSEAVRPVAHSDGDVVLHALVDALLGAMGWGDIGEHFPNIDPQWRDAPSRVFVETVYAKVAAARYGIGNVDITILAEKPKLKPFKSAMVEFIAQLLQVPPDRVNVKAGTNEGCDAIGRGEAVAAHAVVLLAAGD